MNQQLKRGFLEICVLKQLSIADSYGYEIVKNLEDVAMITESTLYPILRRLEDKKYLVTYKEEHNNRIRKYYKITLEGTNRIAEFIEEYKQVMIMYDFIEGK